MTIRDELWSEYDVRVIDQRIGVGIGNLNTVIRVYHKPTGILVEMPRFTRSQHYDRKLAMEMIEYALTEYPEGSKDRA